MGVTGQHLVRTRNGPQLNSADLHKSPAQSEDIVLHSLPLIRAAVRNVPLQTQLAQSFPARP